MADFIIQILKPAISVLIASLIGLFIYFKQKEYEIVRQRYLDNCLDLLCSNISQLLAIFRNNWTMSLHNYQIFNTAGANIETKYYQDRYLKVDQNLLETNAFYRLNILLDDQIFWKATQELIAFVDNSESFFVNDFMMAIKLFVNTDKLQTSQNDICKEYFPKLSSYEEQSHKYYDILTGLQIISTILEEQRFSYKSIRKLKKNKDVKAVINKIKETFPELDKL
jgi:hypothetical protein